MTEEIKKTEMEEVMSKVSGKINEIKDLANLLPPDLLENIKKIIEPVELPTPPPKEVFIENMYYSQLKSIIKDSNTPIKLTINNLFIMGKDSVIKKVLNKEVDL